MKTTTSAKKKPFLEDSPGYKRDTKEFLQRQQDRRQKDTYENRKAQFEKRKGYYKQFIDNSSSGE